LGPAAPGDQEDHGDGQLEVFPRDGQTGIELESPRLPYRDGDLLPAPGCNARRPERSTGAGLELSDMLGADVERSAGKLSSARTWQDRFALLDGYGGRCAAPAARFGCPTSPRRPDAGTGIWWPGCVTRWA
jgi:hypothetical protein